MATHIQRSIPQVFRAMIKLTSDALHSDPAPSGYLHLGFLYEGDGQIEEAAKAFEYALQLDLNFGPARKALQEIDLAR